MLVKIEIYDIDWDYDGIDDDIEIEDIGLPNEWTTNVDIPAEIVFAGQYAICEYLSDIVGDMLSNEFGFCHKGFTYDYDKNLP